MSRNDMMFFGLSDEYIQGQAETLAMVIAPGSFEHGREESKNLVIGRAVNAIKILIADLVGTDAIRSIANKQYDWKPMSSAPKNGDLILVDDGNSGPHMAHWTELQVEGKFIKDRNGKQIMWWESYADWGQPCVDGATHWAPIPSTEGVQFPGWDEEDRRRESTKKMRENIISGGNDNQLRNRAKK